MKMLDHNKASNILTFLENWDKQAIDIFIHQDHARADRYKKKLSTGSRNSEEQGLSVKSNSCPLNIYKSCSHVDGLKYCLAYLFLDNIKDYLTAPPNIEIEVPQSICSEFTTSLLEKMSETIYRFIDELDKDINKKQNFKLDDHKEIWISSHVLLTIRRRLQFCLGLFHSYLLDIDSSSSVFSIRKDYGDIDETLFLLSLDPLCLPLSISIKSEIRYKLVESLQVCCDILSQNDTSQATNEEYSYQKELVCKLISFLRTHLDRTLADSIEDSNLQNNEIIIKAIQFINNDIEKNLNLNSYKKTLELDLARKLLDFIRNSYMPKHMRLLQWEVLIRELKEESISSNFVYRLFSTDQKLFEKSRLYSSTSSEFILGLSDYAYILTESFESNKKIDYVNKIPERVSKIKEWRHHNQKKMLENFKIILSKDVRNFNPNAFHDLIYSFGHKLRRNQFHLHPLDSSIVLEDGEMTFFSIIWMMRCQYAHHGTIKPNFKNSAISIKEFYKRLEDDIDDKKWWIISDSSDSPSIIDQLRFLYKLGLGMIVPRSEKNSDSLEEWEIILTQRASSYIQWIYKTSNVINQIFKNYFPDENINKSDEIIKNLFDCKKKGRFHDDFNELQNILFCEKQSEKERIARWNETIGQFIPYLPIKEYDYSESEKRWIFALFCFFLSDEPSYIFSKWIQEGAYKCNGISIETAIQLFMPSLTLWESLVTPNNKDKKNNQLDLLNIDVVPIVDCAPSDQDILISRMSRCPLFFIEFLFRAFQPYPIQLLIMPHGFTASPSFIKDKSIKEVPTSLVFTSIAGWLPCLSWNVPFIDRNFNDSQRIRTRQISMNFLSPYWEYGSEISKRFTMKNLEESSRYVGEGKGINIVEAKLGHEVIKGYVPVLPLLRENKKLLADDETKLVSEIVEVAMIYGILHTPTKSAAEEMKRIVNPERISSLAWRLYVLRELIDQGFSEEVLPNANSQFKYLWNYNPKIEITGDMLRTLTDFGGNDTIAIRMSQIYVALLVNAIKHHYGVQFNDFFKKGPDRLYKIHKMAEQLESCEIERSITCSVEVGDNNILTLNIENQCLKDSMNNWDWNRGTPMVVDSACRIIVEETYRAYVRGNYITVNEKNDLFTVQCLIPTSKKVNE